MLDFWNYRTHLVQEGLTVLEGLLTRALDQPLQVLLAVTSFLFLSPDAPPAFLFTSVPVLIHLADTLSPTSFFSQAMGLISAPSAGRSLSTTLPVMDNHLEVVGGQTLFSTALAAVTLLPVFAHRQISRRMRWRGSWQEAVGFGLMWAGTWWTWRRASWFGSYGIPSVSASSIPIFDRMLPWAGTMGVDTVLGTTAYLVYQHGSIFSRRIRAPSRSSGSSIMAIEEDSNSDSSALVPKTLSIGMLGLYTVLLASPHAEITSISLPLTEATPFPIGCAIPSHRPAVDLSIEDIIHAAESIGNSAKLIVTPESAVIVNSARERAELIEALRLRVAYKYRTWICLGMQSTLWDIDETSSVEIGKLATLKGGRTNVKRNQVIFFGAEGELASYEKQSLIPLESYPVARGSSAVPIWTIPLQPPPTVNKTTWASSFPFERPIQISPMICLDALHHNLLPSPGQDGPQLLAVSAVAPAGTLSHHLVAHAQYLATSHRIPVFLCASSKGRGTEGISALIDGSGNIVFQQKGGESFVLQTAIPYGKQRRRGGFSWWTSHSCPIIPMVAIAASTLSRKSRRYSGDNTVLPTDLNTLGENMPLQPRSRRFRPVFGNHTQLATAKDVSDYDSISSIATDRGSSGDSAEALSVRSAKFGKLIDHA